MAVGFFVLCVMCLSPMTMAKPHEATIVQQYQVLAPYQTQITQRLDSVSPLLDHIFKQLKQKSLPANLVLVPMLESSYNPKAVSHANAAGLWQLIPATATRFGLRVGDTLDERFDTKASTQAAIRYLEFLYNKFDQDIALTLAAYNAGEGRVARAIKKADSRDFTALTLPKETQQYVNRFYALERLVNIQQLRTDSFQPLLLFANHSTIDAEPLIDLSRLPPLVEL
ncbi:lytic transglycosylase domain-containing protein [Vibrio hyugaensis]|uniref:lytic transglycosylase domain-containing protein n=1 Tax=Vibrio hyugaensis TaxID=1534743 RepID=UPI0005EDA2B4|nr:lytic transglycosylase domain-containing protein [Vibrio hyugaensis]